MDALTTQTTSETNTPAMPNEAAGASNVLSALPKLEHLSAKDVWPSFVERVPIAFARRFGILGLNHENGTLLVAIAKPEGLFVLDKLTTLFGLATAPTTIDLPTLQRVINEAYGTVETGVEQMVDDLGASDSSELIAALSAGGDLLDSAKASPVTRLVNLILLDAVKRRASDIHVQPSADVLQIRFRIDGVLYDYLQPPKRLQEEVISRIKVMGRMNIAEKRLSQDGRTTVKVGDKTIDLRISCLPTSVGERVVLRLLDKSARLYRLPELGMNERELDVFLHLIKKTHGILLVSGPTGSGKSTTLYAALQELDTTELNILTLEDPIEYQLPGISQTQVAQKKGMTFATGLRTVLRQDPDVIMVGEIRDAETARMAIQSSLTGHLVFSTLHTNDAPGAVARLLDLGVEPYLVAGSLLGVLAQRLVRKVCGTCKKKRDLNAADCTALGISRERAGSAVFDAAGCEECQQTGYRDRIGIFELLRIGDDLQELIATNPKSRAIGELAKENGMRSLREAAVEKMFAGETTVEEVLRATNTE